MKCTNLYIAFEAIKHENKEKGLLLPGMNISDYNGTKWELNEKINKGIEYIYNSAKPEKTQYITVFEDGTYKLSKSGNNGYMKILHYGGYQYLFFEFGGYTVLINCQKEGEKFCYKGTIATWEYLPEKKDLFQKIGDQFYMINAYNAFCDYVGQYKGDILQKKYNIEFFNDAKNFLLSDVKLFSVCNNTIVYKGERGYPQKIVVSVTNNKCQMIFTYLILDQLIIIADYQYNNISYQIEPIEIINLEEYKQI